MGIWGLSCCIVALKTYNSEYRPKKEEMYKDSALKKLASSGSSGRSSAKDIDGGEDISKLAIDSFQAREEQIEKRKMEVKMMVESQLNRAEEATKSLAQVWEELEAFTDPMRKEVALARKKVDVLNREVKLLGQTCQKKEKEYKVALEAFQEKNNEKARLTNALIELVKQSESLRMKKLEELSKIVSPIR